MGYLELIFEIKDGTLLDRMESTGLLGQGYNSTRTGFNVTTKPFESSRTPRGLDRCYVSPDYQAHFGDFDFPFDVLQLDTFGPAPVFAMGMNSNDFGDRIVLLKQSLQGLEHIVPGSLNGLMYTGLMMGDYGLMDEGHSKDLIEPLLKS